MTITPVDGCNEGGEVCCDFITARDVVAAPVKLDFDKLDIDDVISDMTTQFGNMQVMENVSDFSETIAIPAKESEADQQATQHQAMALTHEELVHVDDMEEHLREILCAVKTSTKFKSISSWKELAVQIENYYKCVSAKRIQSVLRMQVQKSVFRKFISSLVALQCCVRRGIATKSVAHLQLGRIDVGMLVMENKKLKMKVASVDALLFALMDGNIAYRALQHDISGCAKTRWSLA